MAVQGVEFDSLRLRAETLLAQHGNPLPGGLSSLEEYEAELLRLHGAELQIPGRSGPGRYEPVLGHLRLWLLNPGVFEDVQKHGPSQYAPADEYFHADLFSQVVNFARTSPLRWIEVPSNKGSIRIWSSNEAKETEIAEAAEAAVYGDRMELQPFYLQDCWINFRPDKRTLWNLSPDGQTILRNGREVTNPRSIHQAASYLETVRQHFSQVPQRSD